MDCHGEYPQVLNLRTFDLNLLKVFDVIMTERSLTRAAARLALTQPAVSNALRRLRESLGDELLVRQGRALAPTAHALALWPAIRTTLQQLQTSLAPSPFDPATTRQTFVLTMADATVAELMPDLTDIIEREAPGITLRVVPLTTRDPRPLLEQEHADLAIGYFPAVRADLTASAQSGAQVPFLHQCLFTGDYVCAMRAGHALATGELTLERYCAARHMLVSFSGRAFGFVDEALALQQRTRRVVLTVNQFFTAAKVVAQSELLTVLPRHFLDVTGFGHLLAQRELPFAVPRVQVDAFWHRRQDANPAHAWLRSTVANVAAQAFPPEPADAPANASV